MLGQVMPAMKTNFSSSLRAGLLLTTLLLLNGCATPPDINREVSLFNGRDLTGWRQPTGKWMPVQAVPLDTMDNRKFKVQSGSGVLVNGTNGPTSNILSEYEHGDVATHIEFMVPKGSNSGVYFQGRYEVQVFDSWGVTTPTSSDCGGIYDRWKDNRGYDGHAPKINASLPPGEWQTYDVIFRAPRFDANGKKTENARFVKVVHNGVIIHQNVELTGPTRSATYEWDEKATGPIMIQGDHGPVAYRNITLRPLRLP